MNPNLLYTTAREVVESSPSIMYYVMEMTFTSKAGQVAVKFVNAFDYHGDFIKGFTPAIRAKVGMVVKEFREYVYPYRNNLTVTCKHYPVNPNTGAAVPTWPAKVVEYRAFLVDNQDPSTTRGSALTSGTFVDGSDDMLVFHVQLVDKGAYLLAQSDVGGTYPQDDDNGKLLIAIISKIAKSVKGAVKFLDIRPWDVTTKHETTVIPHDVRAVKLAKYIQEHEGGVYNHGLGSFIFDSMWRIYPPYNLKRFTKALSDRSESTLELYQVPTDQIPTSERTWQRTSSQLRVVCTGPAQVQDISVGKQVSEGNGVRYIRASRFLNAPTTNRGNNTGEVNRSVYMAEIRSSEREDGDTIARFSTARVTDNDAHELSKLAEREGQVYVTMWQNSMAMEYILAGQPVRVYQDKGGRVSVRDGVVLEAKETWLPVSQGMINKAMTRACRLTIFLDKNDVNGDAA